MDTSGAVQDAVRGSLRQRAGAVGRAVLRSLADLRPADTPGWHPLGMDAGDAGMAVVFGALSGSEPDGGWDRVAHEHLTRMVAGLRHGGGPGAGLFAGTAAAAFAVRALAVGGRYDRALATVDELLFRRVGTWLAALPREGGLPVSDYDLISGLTGVGAYLLGAAGPDDEGRAGKLLAAILTRFVSWSEQPAPGGFWTPPEQRTESERAHAPALAGGYYNLGLAHGVAGPLALLALAAERGHLAPGAHRAAAGIVGLLLAGTADTPFGPDVGCYLLPDSEPAAEGLSAAAWCYGNPGVARALQLAGRAFAEPEWERLAWRLVSSVLERPVASWSLSSPILCHGRAGLLYLLHRIHLHRIHTDSTDGAERAGSTVARCAEVIVTLLRELVAEYDECARHGFRNDNPRIGGPDHPGLLQGAAGIGAVLAAMDSPATPNWERLFLIG
ncbi:MAG: lanthionine synthetase C family protein [Sciscionella sp.]